VTTLRPEREGADLYGGHEHPTGYGHDPYAAAAGHLGDPLTDPLPGAQPSPYPPQQPHYPAPHAVPQALSQPTPGPLPPAVPHAIPHAAPYGVPRPAPPAAPQAVPHAAPGPAPAAPRPPAPDGSVSDTAVMPVLPDAAADAPDVPGPRAAARHGRRAARPQSAADAPAPPNAPNTPAAPATPAQPAPGGRAARRRAAQAAAQEGRAAHAAPPAQEPGTGSHRRRQGGSHGSSNGGSHGAASGAGGDAAGTGTGAGRGGHGGHGRRARNGRGTRAASGAATAAAAATAAGAAGAAPAAPTSRLEARRMARAAKESPMVVGSRILGEVFITFGVVMLLFVVYQLWWTNVRAHQAAGGAAKKLEQQWRTGGEKNPSGVFDSGQGFAIMYIPKLDVKAPIAEGVDKHKVLDKGMIGHYSGVLETAMPWDKTGNFAVAAHRNTHGEPFRYINKLVPGDKVIVETAKDWYTYSVTSMLPQTPPSNTTVLRPIPPGSGFTKPGRYLTLTTCTPEFTSKYRLIVWGKMVEVRPRSKGKPAALVG
jgi:sortase A